MLGKHTVQRTAAVSDWKMCFLFLLENESESVTQLIGCACVQIISY